MRIEAGIPFLAGLRDRRIETLMPLFLVVLVVLQGSVSLLVMAAVFQKATDDYLAGQSARAASAVESIISRKRKDLEIKAHLIAGQKKIVDYTQFGLRNLLERELDGLKEGMGISHAGVILPDGVPFSGDATITPEETALTGTGGAMAASTVLENGLPLLSIRTPIERNSEIIGTVFIRERLNEAFVSEIQQMTNSIVILRRGDSFVEAGAAEALRVKSRTGIDYGLLSRKLVAGTRSGAFFIARIDGTAPGIPGTELFILVDARTIERMFLGYERTSLLIVVLSVLLAGWGANLFYSRLFLRPLRRMLEGMEKISRGDFTPPFTITTRNEFDELALAFNTMCSDLMRREHTISELSRSLSLILAGIHTGLVAVDNAGIVTRVNDAAKRMLEGFIGAPLESGVSYRDTVLRLFGVRDGLERPEEPEALRNLHRELVLENGVDRRIMEARGTPLRDEEGTEIGFILLFEDRTEVKALEEKVALSSRLAALGEMAAGVAHQFRNPLGVMKVSAEMLEESLRTRPDGGRDRELSRLLVDEIDSLDHVVTGFLDFARPRRLHLELVAPERLVAAALEKLPPELPGRIRIVVRPEPDLPKVRVDPGLFIQALSNLVTNACEAVDPGTGCVEITCGRDGGIVFRVADNGPGVPEAARKQIFNPFFTTRERGTGLGLSIAHRIAELHGASLEVSTGMTCGAVFSLGIPFPEEQEGGNSP